MTISLKTDSKIKTFQLDFISLFPTLLMSQNYNKFNKQRIYPMANFFFQDSSQLSQQIKYPDSTSPKLLSHSSSVLQELLQNNHCRSSLSQYLEQSNSYSFPRLDSLDSMIPQPNPQPKSPLKQPTDRKKKQGKNSNCIKKIGRMIVKNKNRYKRGGKYNDGAQKMLDSLLQKMETKNSTDMIDSFSTQHLKILFCDCSEEVGTENLEVTKQIFNCSLRKEVLSSSQIKGESKVLYLNTLKCSSLRFSGKTLGLRLQLSQNS